MIKKPKKTLTDLQQYQKNLNVRLAELNAEETQHVKNLYGTPELITIGKILGPEITQVLAKGINSVAGNPSKTPAKPAAKNRGLATR